EGNTSDSERPLSIVGTEHIAAHLFEPFHYTALGHLHQAHYVGDETIRYAGSILKYSISEEHHQKGFLSLNIDAKGVVTTTKCSLIPQRDMRTVEGTIDVLLTHEKNEDYVFIRLTDETPVLSPMEKIRSVYPNAMHVERTNYLLAAGDTDRKASVDRTKMSDLELFRAFYKEVKGHSPGEETESLFQDVLEERMYNDDEQSQKNYDKITQRSKRRVNVQPLKLTMTAFGPYKERETIDCEKLGDHKLFVISGNTGAGKTTIFDGICFALFGSASGTDRDNHAMLRSDFADDDTHT